MPSPGLRGGSGSLLRSGPLLSSCVFSRLLHLLLLDHLPAPETGTAKDLRFGLDVKVLVEGFGPELQGRMFRLRRFTQGRHGAVVWRAWVWKHVVQGLGVARSEEEGRGGRRRPRSGSCGTRGREGGLGFVAASSL